MPDSLLDSRFGRASRSNGRQIHVASQPREVEKLTAAWQQLINRQDRPVSTFQTPHWVLALLRHQFRDRQTAAVRVVAVEAGKELILVAPLAITFRRGVAVLQWLGEPLSAYGDVVAAPHCDVAEIMGEVVAELQAQGDIIDVIHFPKTRADAAIAPFLKNFSRIPFSDKRAPYLDLTAFSGFDDYVASRSSRAMKDYRRKRRRLAELGELDFRMHPAGERASELGHQALELKTKWMKAHGKVSRAFADPTCLASLLEFLRMEGSGGVVWELSLDGNPVALEIGFISKKRYYSYIGAMDLDYARFSTGQLQLLETLRACFEKSIEVFDFLPSDSEYKRAWSTDLAEESEWIYSCSLKGMLYESLVLKGFMPISRRLYSRTPLMVRRPAQSLVQWALRG